MNKTLLSIGHGYSAQALARRLLPQGWRIIGTTRSADKAREIAASGVEPLIWPEVDLEPLLGQIPNVLISIGPGAYGDPLLNAYEATIARVAQGLRWVGYLSTTGVYGNHDGGWVDENTALTPATRRGAARMQAASSRKTKYFLVFMSMISPKHWHYRCIALHPARFTTCVMMTPCRRRM